MHNGDTGCRTGTFLLTLLTMTALPVTAAEPLSLESMGVFYVGGTRVESPYSDGRGAALPTSVRTTVGDQAKITFLVPAAVSDANIILVPGLGLSSGIYLTTPDGREGWARLNG